MEDLFIGWEEAGDRQYKAKDNGEDGIGLGETRQG